MVRISKKMLTFLTTISNGIFFFGQLESNHVLLLYSKVTENANCYVSRLFCESEFFFFFKKFVEFFLMKTVFFGIFVFGSSGV